MSNEKIKLPEEIIINDIKLICFHCKNDTFFSLKTNTISREEILFGFGFTEKFNLTTTHICSKCKLKHEFFLKL